MPASQFCFVSSKLPVAWLNVCFDFGFLTRCLSGLELGLGIASLLLHQKNASECSGRRMGRGRSRSDSRSRSRGRGKSGRGDDTEHIQQMVDERQAARRDRDFDKADRMREELKELGVRIDDTQLTWNAPGGMRGVVNNPGGKGPIEKRDGDWICKSCGKLVFATKAKGFWGDDWIPKALPLNNAPTCLFEVAIASDQNRD